MCSCISSSFGTDLQSRTCQVWKRQTIDDESWCTYGNKKSKRNKQWMLSFFQSHLFKTSLHQHVKLLCLQFALFKKKYFSAHSTLETFGKCEKWIIIIYSFKKELHKCDRNTIIHIFLILLNTWYMKEKNHKMIYIG